MKNISRKEREEDILARVKNCTHCKETYTFPDKIKYILKAGSYRVTCLKCFEHSYMDKPLNGAAYGSFQIIAIAVGLACFFFVNIPIYFFGYITGFGIGFGILSSMAVSGSMMRAYKWKYGRLLSRDPL